MSDESTTISKLKLLVQQFVEERHWQQFHSPKNLTMALAIEAAELMEHYQWLDETESRDATRDPEKLSLIGEELADVICYAIALANELGIDIDSTVRAKMIKNEAKYPVPEIRGRYGHDDRRPVQ